MALKSIVLVASLIASIGSTAFAQTPPVRLRGTVNTIEGQSMTMTSREGKVLKVAITPDTRYAYVKAMEMADIKSGSFIGAAGRPGKDGAIDALEVVVFQESGRGSNEGHYAWDLLPDSSMTNATVAAVVEGTSGRELNLVYKDGSKKVTVKSGVPIVTILPGVSTDVMPGVPVFVVAVPKESGEYTATRIVSGKDGVAPPM